MKARRARNSAKKKARVAAIDELIANQKIAPAGRVWRECNPIDLVRALGLATDRMSDQEAQLALIARYVPHALVAFESLAKHVPKKAKVRQQPTRPATTPTTPAAPKARDVNSDAFLLSYEWKRVRMVVLKRDGAKCRCCGASPATGAVMNVDHIKPRRIFPELALDPNNLQVLCGDCNHGKGNWDMTDWRAKEAV